MSPLEAKLGIARTILDMEGPFTLEDLTNRVLKKGYTTRTSVIEDVLYELRMGGFVDCGHQDDGSCAYTVERQPAAFAWAAAGTMV